MKLVQLHESTNFTVADYLKREGKVWKDLVHDHIPGLKLQATSLNDLGLTSLEGCPTKVDLIFYAMRNKLTSFKGGPQIYKKAVNLIGNPITNLRDVHKDVKEVRGHLYLDFDKIKSHVLGVMKISGCEGIYTSSDANQKFRKDEPDWVHILNGHIKKKASIYECQEALINAGFDEYAQL